MGAAERASTTVALSYGERALWFLHQLAPESAAYNVALPLRLPTHADPIALRRALQHIVDRHDVLRSTYLLEGATPVRRIHTQGVVPFDEVDARGWSAEDLSDMVAARSAEPFDLATGPLFRCVLFRRETQCLLLGVSHHIAADSWSVIGIIVPELLAGYAAIVDGHSVDLAAPPLATYSEHVEWQSSLLQSTAGCEHRAYWHARLAGDLPVLELRSDRARPARKSFTGATHHFSIPRDLARELKQLGRQQRTTVSAVLLSAFALLLNRYSGQSDLVIGSPLSGRTDRRFKRTSCLVHVLVIALHHTVADAWSLGVLARELAHVYEALSEQRQPQLPELRVQYADFARWQRDWFQGEILEQQLEYWRHQLAGLQPLQLPTDRLRPAEPTYRGMHRAFDFPRPLLEQLRNWSQSENATPFMAFLTAFASILHRYTSQTDVAIGVPIANRRWLHTEGLLGPLVNTLVVRTDFSENPSGRDVLRQVRTRALDA